MERTLRDKRIIALFVLPGFILFALMFILPMVSTFFFSFTNWNGIKQMQFNGISNYINLLTDDPIFWKGVKNTFIILIFAVTGQLIPAFIFALCIETNQKGKKFFKTSYFIPVMLSTVAISLLWSKIYEPNNGLLIQLLSAAGFENLSGEWLSKSKTAIYAVCIPIIWQYIGYHLVILYAGLKTIPKQYYEAALIDGAGGLKAVFKVTIPLLQDIIKVCVVLSAIGSLKMFDQIFVMTKGGPFNSTMTVALQMYNEAFLKMNYGYGSAVVVFLVVECLLISYIINKILTRERIEF